MKQVNVYHPFLISSFQRKHSLTLSDLKWKSFEAHDFLGDGEDWQMLMENMLSEKGPALLKQITFGEDPSMFSIHSEDKDALHAIVDLVFEFYDDDALLDACIARYAQFDFEPEVLAV